MTTLVDCCSNRCGAEDGVTSRKYEICACVRLESLTYFGSAIACPVFGSTASIKSSVSSM
jgi:hypothetical protein